MNTRSGRVSRGQKSKNFQGEGPNWILIAGGALLSTLSIRLGYKLKQALDTKQKDNATTSLKGHGTSDRRRLSGCRLHSNMFSFTQEDDGCFNCISGTESIGEKHPPNGLMLPESEVALPLVTVPTSEFNKDNGVMWASSPDRLELPPKPFHHSNCSDSPCVSESGSDIFSKREVIQKLRQQLKRRDDMILEMQDQIMELQNSLNAQVAHSSHLQAQLDASNRDLFDSEREIQRLRKAIADHCVGHVSMNEKTTTVTAWPPDIRNGHANGYLDGESNSGSPEKGRGDGERIEMLKREVGELKEVIEGKEYLLQSYKEQKTELSMKIKELQQRLDSQLPNILMSYA
ncbi:Intracellular protein transport protein USO1 isoform 3 [Theobroma cacao]|uniref:Intracellular protein transport protein USO1 isoform 3 n=1 Tax=Theobroma cacao TaxID=3641 RepID=A0A061EZK7_THECC|nr:Intracellular protein transport protein USO1 isoform 3 [Theobroma cacao]